MTFTFAYKEHTFEIDVNNEKIECTERGVRKDYYDNVYRIGCNKEIFYSADSNGNVIAYNITKRVEDWYEHMVTLTLSSLKDIRVNMDMYHWVDDEDNTIMYFADKDNALGALREIAEKANKVVQNCLKSMDIFI